MSEATTAPEALTNDHRMKDLMKDVREFGRLEAQGKDALPMLALKVAYASADGVISGAKDPDGSDDYSRIYAEYTKERAKKAVHEHTVGGLKANISKLRQIGTAAAMPTCDFYASINALLAMREELLNAEVKVRPAYHSIVELARTQTAQPEDVTAEQIEEAAKKPEGAEKTIEGELKRAEKILADLISGEKGVTCQDQEVIDAHGLISTKLAAFVHTRDASETIAKAQLLGITLPTSTLIPAEQAQAA